MTTQDTNDREFEELLSFIRVHRGFDYTGYKRTSLRRRFLRRMSAVDADGFHAYLEYLQSHPDEFTLLFNTILINVTSFFRDPPAWDYLADEIVPSLLSQKAETDPIRIWCAGCASGEETYTTAMVFAEALGEARFRERVKIYATDIDDEALTQARQAVYAERQVEHVPEALRERYFEPLGPRFSFRRDLRRTVIFGRHDLLQDAPISRVDLLVCRNALMYFKADAQARILSRLHFALNDAGVLFLGKAEMLLTHAHLFLPRDLRRRFFVKVPRNDVRERLLIMAETRPEEAPSNVVRLLRLREFTFDSSPVAQLAFDANRALVLANERARHLFGLGARELGVALRELDLGARLPQLRQAVEVALSGQGSVPLPQFEWSVGASDARFLDGTVTPLIETNGVVAGVSISFIDMTAQRRLQDAVHHTHQELETAYEELQSTNEELETTNEELQSTTEELETTNEELQSANEELETMNEELQSTNEELETMNDELRGRTEELGQVNAFLESILGGLRSAVVVLDGDMQVQLWNRHAEALWGLRSDEVVNQHFMNLDVGLPLEQLRNNIRACLAGDGDVPPLELETTDRRGRAVRVAITCMPLLDLRRQVKGAILLTDRLVPVSQP